MKTILAKAVRPLSIALERDAQHIGLLDCAIILGALPDISEFSIVRGQLADRLRDQLTPEWIVNGDDAYEVFSVLVALWRYNAAWVSGEHLAAAVERLVKNEVAAGGPYYSQGQVSIAANLQIAIFLRLVAKPLPNVDAFLKAAITSHHLDDPKLAETDIIYLLDRAFGDAELAQYVKGSWRQTDWQTPAHQAVALAVLKDNMEPSDIKNTVQALSDQQQSDGFWAGESSDSSFVTTAFIVEILTRLTQAKPKESAFDLRHRQRSVALAARKMFDTYAEPLRSSAFTAVNEICIADSNFEITLLPHFFAEALKSSVQIADHKRAQLGLASLYVWMAYTIYDDFLDGEGEPDKLPVANIAMRASLDCFRLALPAKDFQRYVAHVFSGMDETNAWEVNHCRFMICGETITITQLPNYNQCIALATRSLAHALGPMALLMTQSTKNIRRIESAFRHYLIARQLNDDLHDWLKDIQSGQISYVVAAILRDLKVKPGTYVFEMLVPAMQKCFRQKTMMQVCRQIRRHTAASKRDFIKSDLLRPVNSIYALLDGLELSVQDSLDQQAKAQAFARMQNSVFGVHRKRST